MEFGKVDSIDGYTQRLARLDYLQSRRSISYPSGVLTYPNSPDYRPDIDALPPVQVRVYFHYI